MLRFGEEKRRQLRFGKEKRRQLEVRRWCCTVEAWASGLTLREMMMDYAMDEGDLARLLQRTIDILAQIPKLSDIDTLLQSNAKTASNVMDRPPISELAR
nr:dexh-box atp-dependent rna helicase dexh15 chloroplastic [Quercus suber]